MKWFNLYLIIFNRRHTSCKLTQQQHKATTPLLASHLSTVVVTRFFGSLSSFVGPSLGYPFFFTAIIRHRPERVQHLWYTTPSLFKWNHISYFPTMADKNYHQGESRVCLDMSCLCRCLNEISNTLIAPISTHNSTMQPLYQFKTYTHNKRTRSQIPSAQPSNPPPLPPPLRTISRLCHERLPKCSNVHDGGGGEFGVFVGRSAGGMDETSSLYGYAWEWAFEV